MQLKNKKDQVRLTKATQKIYIYYVQKIALEFVEEIKKAKIWFFFIEFTNLFIHYIEHPLSVTQYIKLHTHPLDPLGNFIKWDLYLFNRKGN